jgi:Zn2+/Cd2+-exporting ATPase
VVGTEELVGRGVAGSWGAADAGALRVYAAGAGGARGVFTLQDEVREEAPRVVRRLHALGVRPIVMLTGDSADAAQAVGRATGVDAMRWRLLPQKKVDAVRALRTEHGSVGMLGDGVNDAPALAAATVGLAMGGAGSPATIETAGVALMADDLNQLPYAVRLARRARRLIRANIALALALKLVLAVGAVLGVACAVPGLVPDLERRGG